MVTNLQDDGQNTTNDAPRDAQNDDVLFKGDQSRFVDYTFGNVQTQNLEITGSVAMSAIAMGNPLDGGTVSIPSRCSVVILKNTANYTQLTVKMPLQPVYGQLLTIVSTVNVANITLAGSSFGTAAPASLVAGVPVRFIFAGQWFNI